MYAVAGRPARAGSAWPWSATRCARRSSGATPARSRCSASTRRGAPRRIELVVTNAGREAASFNVDLRVHFVKAGGRAAPKEFTVRAVRLEPGASIELARTISLAQHRTRTHRPGDHAVDVVVNGRAEHAGSFDLGRPD